MLALILGVGGASAEPRVSLNAAEKTALARVPGKVFAAKLKTKKKKFPHPVWSLKIEADKRWAQEGLRRQRVRQDRRDQRAEAEEGRRR